MPKGWNCLIVVWAGDPDHQRIQRALTGYSPNDCLRDGVLYPEHAERRHRC
jgi:hypothetical protein